MENEARLKELKAEENQLNSDIDHEIEKIIKMKNNKLEMFIDKLREKHDLL